ncbi:MAG: hypothetical protein GY745_01195 [Actinomycetia bacterium]|nr:hypothetical protein [Actinomycetes bacterium]
MRFRRRQKFPAEMLAEAARLPGGTVYEIDSRFDRDGAVPAHAIVRGWTVGPDGRPTGEHVDNPGYGVRVPLSDVDQIVADARAHSAGDSLEVFVSDELTLGGNTVAFDVGIAIVMDQVLGLGFAPGDEPWMSEIDGGRAYSFERIG